MSINVKLLDLYTRHWEGLLDKGRGLAPDLPTNPMLLCLNEEHFSTASKRIIICGQEPWGWDGFGTSIEDGMKSYHRFFIEEQFYPGYGQSAFWKAFRFIKAAVCKLFENEDCCFVWQNVSKMGRNDGETGVTDVIRSLERQSFPVFRDEIALLRPDIVVFLTGPNRDWDIKFHFPDAKFNPVSKYSTRQMAIVKSSDLPAATLRLYHPNFYRAFTKSYKSAAVDQIRLLHQKACAPLI